MPEIELEEKQEKQQEEKKEIISTGHAEIDKKLGGGIPVGSLTLVEGQSDAGKSVVCQQMMWGSLKNDFKVVLFTTENTVKSMVTQMDSLGLSIKDYLLLGWVKIYTMRASQVRSNAVLALQTLLNSMRTLLPRLRLVPMARSRWHTSNDAKLSAIRVKRL